MKLRENQNKLSAATMQAKIITYLKLRENQNVTLMLGDRLFIITYLKLNENHNTPRLNSLDTDVIMFIENSSSALPIAWITLEEFSAV